MRKQKTNFRLCLFVLMGAAIATFTASLSVPEALAQENTSVPVTSERAVSFEKSYPAGTTVQLPATELSDGQNSYPARAVVTTPSGMTVNGESVVLTEAGQYTVSYIAGKPDGAVLKEEYTFIATEELYSVTSSLSSVTYGHSLPNYDITSDVVLASISSRDRFEYRPMIDLNGLAGNEFIEFFVTPETIGTPDAMKIQIVLTDAYDSDNFVVISVKKGTAAQEGAAWAELNSYITANAVGQVPAGLEKGYTGLVVYGNEYRLQKGTVWGANVRFALPGTPDYSTVTNPNNNPERVAAQSLKFSLDNESGDIYANGQLVTVLKNSDIYGETLWSGFTTGECYLSVYGETFNSASLGLGIKSLGGISFTDGMRDNIFSDTSAPEITLDFGDEREVPAAVAGRTYKLFGATAVDDYSGECAVTSEVYYNYGTDGEVRLNVVDNAFVPMKEGAYKIVYRASDRYGNEAVETIDVTADPANAAELSVAVAEAANGKAGEEYTVAVPVFTGARGTVHWSAVAVLDGDQKVRYDISSEEGTFIPEYAGTYTLIYSYGDYVYSGTVQKTFNVQSSAIPVLDGVPVFPKYIILGCEYRLEELWGTVYTDGTPVRKTCDIYVSDDGAAERKINGKLITYADHYVEIVYRISDGEGCEIRSEKILVIDVGYNGTYKIENYFDGDDFSSLSSKNDIRFTADRTDAASARMTFINPLQTFDFSMRAYASGSGFTKLNVILTDSQNDAVQLKFTYRNASGMVWFSINGGEEISLSSASFNSADSPLFLAFNGLTNTVMPTGVSVISYPVTTDLRGNLFQGFRNMSAYMTVELENITNNATASVSIVNINGQRISNIYTDTVKPQLSATTASGDRVQGTEYVIPKVYASDVLDVVKGSLTVTAPDGSYAVTKDGVTLQPGSEISRDYTIVLEQFGAYTITYEVSDICGNKLLYEYVLRSADFTAPDVKIVSPETQTSVGKSVRVANILITDNKDKNLEDFTVFVTVTSPNNRIYSLTDGDGQSAASFTATLAGEYTVTYLVLDSSGNMAMVSYKVYVK